MAKIQTPKPIRGTQDIFGDEQERFAYVVETFNRVRKLYGFKGVEMPVIEPTGVFARSLGETTDIVSKEMYTFDDRGGDSVTLRPEFTAGICRAYITNGWQQYAPLKLSTWGPLFRYERPQKGRYRQFHQIDAEIIGAAEPAADVDLLVMADQLLKELGISEGVTLQLNTLGDSESREAWRAGLVAHFEAHRDQLSEESLDRLTRNPLRILDSKDPRDIPVAATAPDIDAYLTDEARGYFEAVTAGLDAAGVAWVRNPRLVRGMDYYRHTAFEFVPDPGSACAEKLGSQSTLLGGGRYDGLIEALGGPVTPAVGWAAGIERLAMLVEDQKNARPNIVVTTEHDDCINEAIALAAGLRRKNLATELVVTGSRRKRYDKSQLHYPEMVMLIMPNDDGYLGNMLIEIKRGKGAGEISHIQSEALAEEYLRLIGLVHKPSSSNLGFDFMFAWPDISDEPPEVHQ